VNLRRRELCSSSLPSLTIALWWWLLVVRPLLFACSFYCSNRLKRRSQSPRAISTSTNGTAGNTLPSAFMAVVRHRKTIFTHSEEDHYGIRNSVYTWCRHNARHRCRLSGACE